MRSRWSSNHCFFFALAKIPNLSRPNGTVELGNDNQPTEEEDISAQVTSPPIHQLSEEEEVIYRPIFDELVDVEKVHFNHGKPETSVSMASLQLKSLAAFRAAHHNVSVMTYPNLDSTLLMSFVSVFNCMPKVSYSLLSYCTQL